jgi:hypothetical protein
MTQPVVIRSLGLEQSAVHSCPFPPHRHQTPSSYFQPLNSNIRGLMITDSICSWQAYAADRHMQLTDSSRQQSSWSHGGQDLDPHTYAYPSPPSLVEKRVSNEGSIRNEGIQPLGCLIEMPLTLTSARLDARSFSCGHRPGNLVCIAKLQIFVDIFQPPPKEPFPRWLLEVTA